jgi:hypothetical protein
MIRVDSRIVFVRMLTRSLLVLPFLALPFAIFTSEMWFQMQIFSNDYELTTLRSERERTRAQIERLEDRGSQLKTLRQLEASVPFLGLIEPEPGQIHVIRMSESDLRPEPSFEESPQRFADAGTLQ